MFSSFSSALSALNADSDALAVVGNNLANLNTTGYKEQTASFHDLVAESIGSVGSSQVGFGVAKITTSRDFAQGALQTTGGPLDSA
ncbi:MAG: flagellar hook-basal body complex protein, partial [Candidatus Dormibacteraceae bacterium]